MEQCGDHQDLDNDGDGIPNYADVCPNDSYWDNGNKGYDLDYTLNDNGGFVTEEECLAIEGAIWNAYTNHCGDGVCDNFDLCVGIGEDSFDCVSVEELPTALKLKQNYPNPFNPKTKITFVLNESDFVTLSIYDLQGRHIKTLASGDYNQGSYDKYWDAIDKDCLLYTSPSPRDRG